MGGLVFATRRNEDSNTNHEEATSTMVKAYERLTHRTVTSPPGTVCEGRVGGDITTEGKS